MLFKLRGTLKNNTLVVQNSHTPRDGNMELSGPFKSTQEKELQFITSYPTKHMHSFDETITTYHRLKHSPKADNLTLLEIATPFTKMNKNMENVFFRRFTTTFGNIH